MQPQFPGKLLYGGSVKDIWQRDQEKESALYFSFSDRYSVFDWGEMPDLISHKGEALAHFSALFFEITKKLNLSSHFLDTVDLKGEKTPLQNPKKLLKVKKVEILRPDWDGKKYNYKAYEKKPAMTLIPLEVVFRLGLPKGSSLPGRLQKPSPEFLEDLKSQNFSYEKLKNQKEGELFSEVMVEFFTKLEPQDRWLSQKEAREISYLSEENFQEVITLTKQLARELQKIFKSIGVVLWDGKFEFAWDQNRNIMIVDALGPDELRLTTEEGNPWSKEFLRLFYRKTPWYQEIEKAKKKSGPDWKQGLNPPPPLPKDYLQAAQDLYLSLAQSLSEKILGLGPFPEAKSLKEVDQDLQKLGEFS